nr:unnamed protein product [Spirometra erinaceieuropaei]
MPDESEIYAALLFSCIYCSIVYVCGQLLKKCLSHVFCLLDSHSTLEFGETSESASSISSLPRDDCSGRHRQNEQPQNAAGVSKAPNSPLWSDEAANAAFSLATDSTGGMPSLSLPQPPFYAALLSPLHKALQDAVSTFQLCACSLENGIVRATFGIKGLILVIGVHNLIMTQLAWADSYGSPCNAFYRSAPHRPLCEPRKRCDTDMGPGQGSTTATSVGLLVESHAGHLDGIPHLRAPAPLPEARPARVSAARALRPSPAGHGHGS